MPYVSSLGDFTHLLSLVTRALSYSRTKLVRRLFLLGEFVRGLSCMNVFWEMLLTIYRCISIYRTLYTVSAKAFAV